MTKYDLGLLQFDVLSTLKSTLIPYLGKVEDRMSILEIRIPTLGQSKKFDLPVLQTSYMLLGVLLQMPLREAGEPAFFTLLDYEDTLEFRLRGDKAQVSISNDVSIGTVNFAEFVHQLNQLVLQEHRVAKSENRLDGASQIRGPLTLPIWLETS
jgi:hypothetical protein